MMLQGNCFSPFIEVLLVDISYLAILSRVGPNLHYWSKFLWLKQGLQSSIYDLLDKNVFAGQKRKAFDIIILNA